MKRAGGAALHPKNEGQYGSACQTLPAQSLSCPRPSLPFRRLATARLIDGSTQANERLRQARFDRLLIDIQMLGDLLQGHCGEAMENEDVATVAWQSADRPDEHPALAFFS